MMNVNAQHSLLHNTKNLENMNYSTILQPSTTNQYFMKKNVSPFGKYIQDIR